MAPSRGAVSHLRRRAPACPLTSTPACAWAPPPPKLGQGASPFPPVGPQALAGEATSSPALAGGAAATTEPVPTEPVPTAAMPRGAVPRAAAPRGAAAEAVPTEPVASRTVASRPARPGAGPAAGSPDMGAIVPDRPRRRQRGLEQVTSPL